VLKDYLTHAHTLSQSGQPFVIATVVRTHAPTSAKAGMKAIVTADGALTGWVGGSCTQPTVVRESLKALQDGSPRFLRLGPPEELRGETPGVIEVPLTCVSGGTLEIYLDPHLPSPTLLIVGHLPVVEALVEIGKALHYSVTVMGEDVTPERFPGVEALPLDIASLNFTPQTNVVVASHGNYDEPALEAALNGSAAYVALIASRKRRDSILDYLRGSGLTDEQLARLRCPAGLDIGSVTPEEIALSILAEIVQLRRQSPISSLQFSNLQAPREAIDPVCHMTVEIASARYTSTHAGQTYYFCSPGCKRSFEKEPEKYLVVVS
jgi:xanthine dehydrogenase accessory factor